MGRSLSSRLALIRSETRRAQAPAEPAPPTPPKTPPGAFGPSWRALTPLVLRRDLRSRIEGPSPSALPADLLAFFPRAAGAFGPDSGPAVEKLLLFDLETTGLSGGAGTVAFLAACGGLRAVEGEGWDLEIRQYLLLDYGGEGEFLDAVLGEFASEPVLVTYNGKSFDSQILRSRCVMNGVFPPDPPHLDLVYPARRLWRRLLGSCSLVDVETGVLGLSREGDISGAEAPDAWFDFLRTGVSERLEGVADHNARDIAGLAGLLLLLSRIAQAPERSLAGPPELDGENLALTWLAASTIHPRFLSTARDLLAEVSSGESPRAAFALARELRRDARGAGGRGAPPPTQARSLLREVSSSTSASATLRASACRILATASLRDGSCPEAISWLERALALEGLPAALREALQARRDRLLGAGRTCRL